MSTPAEKPEDAVRPAPVPQPAADAPTFTQADIERVHNSDDFALLRQRFRSFAFPMTVAFVVWYFLYVLLSTYAPAFMSTPLIGTINLGIAMGLGQFLTTFLITWLYVRHANRSLDPLAAQLRSELEGGE